MKTAIYKPAEERIWADISNESNVDSDIVGLTQSDEVKDFFGNSLLFMRVIMYIYMRIWEKITVSYIFFEGYVIPNPYDFLPYKWCCKLKENKQYFEYSDEYNKRFDIQHNMRNHGNLKLEYLRNNYSL